MQYWPEWFKDPEQGDPMADATYARDHAPRPSFIEVVRQVNALDDSASILDVGCGPLGLLGRVGPQFTRGTAVDNRVPAVLSFDTSRFQFVQADFAHFARSRPNAYDVVTALEVMEHVRPDVRREFAKLLLYVAARHLFVTIPYNWRDCTEPVPHNGYNESHIMEWFWPCKPDEMREVHGHLLVRFDAC